jgi:hypothetical protein
VGDPASGLALVDIADPTVMNDTRLVRTVDWAGSNPEDVILSGRHVWVSDATEGLKVLELAP